MTTLRTLSLSLSFGAFALLAGCDNTPSSGSQAALNGSSNLACAATADCPSGEECVEKVCKNPNASSDTGSGTSQDPGSGTSQDPGPHAGGDTGTGGGNDPGPQPGGDTGTGGGNDTGSGGSESADAGTHHG